MPTQYETGLESARACSRLGECSKRKVGCAIFKGERIVGWGWNKSQTCLLGACPGAADLKPCMAVHAEVAAIIEARQDLRGSVFYVSAEPCGSCKEAAASVGADRIVWPQGELSFRS